MSREKVYYFTEITNILAATTTFSLARSFVLCRLQHIDRRSPKEQVVELFSQHKAQDENTLIGERGNFFSSHSVHIVAAAESMTQIFKFSCDKDF